MADLIGTLREDHDNARRLLDLLEHEADAFAAGEDADFDVIEGVIDYFRGYLDAYHHPLEDRIVARLKGAAPDRMQAVDDLLRQHQTLRRALHDVADDLDKMHIEVEMPRSRIVDGLKGFAQAYRSHMAGEEADFFPLAEAVLGAADWQAIQTEMTGQHDPLFGGREGFDGLRKRLLAADSGG